MSKKKLNFFFEQVAAAADIIPCVAEDYYIFQVSAGNYWSILLLEKRCVWFFVNWVCKEWISFYRLITHHTTGYEWLFRNISCQSYLILEAYSGSYICIWIWFLCLKRNWISFLTGSCCGRRPEADDERSLCSNRKAFKGSVFTMKTLVFLLYCL